MAAQSQGIIGDRYFMTEEQKDAVIGRVLREKREADHHLALLKSEAKRVADRLNEIAALIQDNPQSIVFENEALHPTAGPWQRCIRSSDFDFSKFQVLIADVRSAVKKADDKKRELETLLP